MTSKEVLTELNELIHDSPVRVPVEFMKGLKDAVDCIEDLEERIAIMEEGRWIRSDHEPENGKYFVLVSHAMYGKEKYYQTDYSIGKYENGKWKIAWYLDFKVLAYMPMPDEMKVGDWV